MGVRIREPKRHHASQAAFPHRHQLAQKIKLFTVRMTFIKKKDQISEKEKRRKFCKEDGIEMT